MHIAGGYATPCRGNTDLRFFEIGLIETDGVKHGATGRLFDTVDNDGGVGSFVAHGEGWSIRSVEVCDGTGIRPGWGNLSAPQKKRCLDFARVVYGRLCPSAMRQQVLLRCSNVG